MEQRVKNNTRKSQKDSQIIKVVTRWEHAEEVPPAFKRLMMLLLEPRNKRRVNRDEKRNPQ